MVFDMKLPCEMESPVCTNEWPRVFMSPPQHNWISKYLNSNFCKYPGSFSYYFLGKVTNNHTFLEPEEQ